MTQRICILTAGSLASTPRMLKAADALHEAGYKVRLVCTEHVDWAVNAGKQIRATRPWRCQVVDWHRDTGRWLYYRSALRHRFARGLSSVLGPGRLPLGWLARAVSRIAAELIDLAVSEPADLVYGGTAGGLAASALAARRLGVPYALDLEDFHTGELPHQPQHRWARAMMEEIERRVLPRAAFLTAGSAPIAAAYRAKYGVTPIPVNNVFPLPRREPELTARPCEPLRLFWFSQVIGPGRGLEDAIRAAGMLDRPVWLSLLGNLRTAYAGELRSLASLNSPKLHLEFLLPCAPEDLLDACRASDVGLAIEPGFSPNNDLALSNKLFTYLLAGAAVAVTETSGQHAVAEDLGEGAILYRPGDFATLAAGLRRWADDPAELLRAKRACWEAARRRWHWEHPLERGALLGAVAAALRNHEPWRILLTVDPEIPVPPRLYGGIERIVAGLVEGLRSRGHVVGLAAHPESTAPADAFFPWPGQRSGSRVDTIRNARALFRAVRAFRP